MVVERWWFLLLSFSAVAVQVIHGQPGFISIDCGIPASRNYTDDITGITYISDSTFINTGVNYKISSPTLQESTLRSFANEPPRNCYTIRPVKSGLKYLVRASFMYGNYDNNDTTGIDPIVFDLHIGVNFWEKINISDATVVYRAEALMVPTKGYLWVCLVDIGSGTPFISSLEMRPLKKILYPAVNATNPLVLFKRFDIGSPFRDAVRYPDDPYDRMWDPISFPEYWLPISTNLTVLNIQDDFFEVPSIVMQSAVIPTPSNNTDLKFSWTARKDNPIPMFYMFMHFAEIQPRAQQKKYLRLFDVFINEIKWSPEPFNPNYLSAGSIYSVSPATLKEYNVTISKANGSVLPPIFNALEIYYVMHLPEIGTDGGDVDAMMAIKTQYEIKRNWMGDPCAPSIYAWDGLNCSYSDSELPRITALNLSSSGLTGEISQSLANLKTINFLDLSNNILTGNIPDFLAYLPSLKLLNLTGNQLNGSIPSALLRKMDNGELLMSFGGNPDLCITVGSCEKKKKKSSAVIIVIASVISIFLVLLVLVVFFVWRIRRKGKQGSVTSTMVKPQSEGDVGIALSRDDQLFQHESQQFTFKELEKITRNFERDIGTGGFGTVYLGYLENGTQVAVKMRSQSSHQGIKEFLSEAQLLTRVHHRNLVSLVGYCKDGNNLALVYEYMAQGSLQEHLRGKYSKGRYLNWGERLRIALESAQGLEYLHKGCSPPIVHRDVKTTNILLNRRLEAKLADFGLSKAFLSDEHTHVSTVVGGTLGYLDPEYYKTYQLNEKSDVFSFGVVLLELITGHPPLPEGSDKGHISQWVRLRLARGDISDIADSRLQGEYDINSIWKVVDIAMKCTAQASIQRPMMGDVITQLKEGLALEVAHQGPGDPYSQPIESGSVNSLNFAYIGQTSVVTGPSAR